MSEWKTYRLGDICKNVCSGGTPKSTEPSYYGGNIPWLNTKEVNFCRIDKTEKTITDSGFQNSSTKWIEKNSVIVAMYGATAAKVAVNMIPLTTNQACCNLTIDPNLADFRFVYFYLCYKYTSLAALANGGAQQNLNAQRIKDFDITLPPLEEQKRIADILWSLDDKIELNRRINANLEAQAQALFRSWFVDFEPFRDGPFVDSELGKIPQGWKICRLKDATKEIIRGFTSKYVEKSDLINLNQKVNKGQYLDRQYYKFLNPEIAIPTNKFAQQNDILLNSLGQGTLGRVHYYGELTPNIVIDQHITIIRANNTTFQPSFIYLFLSSNEVQYSIEGMVTGSTGMQMLNISQVREMNILQPDVNTMNKFHNIVQPFFVEIRKNNAETEIIAKIRDTLLPKLMAGEIKI